MNTCRRPTKRASIAAVLLATLGGLGGCAPPGGPTDGAAAAPAPVSEDRGARLYEANCLSCHQQHGQGIPGVYPPLAGSPVVLGDPAAFAAWVVKGRRAASMTVGRYPTSMPAFGWMNARDAAALATFLRGSFGNQGAPVSEADVAAALSDR
jgi:mono/diheme cytochrome c family protein